MEVGVGGQALELVLRRVEGVIKQEIDFVSILLLQMVVVHALEKQKIREIVRDILVKVSCICTCKFAITTHLNFYHIYSQYNQCFVVLKCCLEC